MATPRKPRPNRPGDEGAVLFRGPGASDSPVKLEGEALIVNVDSRAIVDAARRAALRVSRDNIAEGKKPDGSPQKPLSKGVAAQPGRAGPVRGYKTGHMADNLRSTPIKGTTAKAETTIMVPTDRNVFIAQEAKRGIEYLGFGAVVDAAIVEAVDDYLELMLDGLNVEAEQGEPRAKDVDK